MSNTANMNLVCEWVEQVWNAGNIERLTDFHPSTVDNEGHQATIEDIRQWHVRTRTSFPDIHYTIDDMFAADDRVALRWTATATHRGALWNVIPPTGKTITWTGVHLLRLAEQRIVEIWALQNGVAQLRQMGVTLQPASDSAEPPIRG
jgi:predicted ester cyclase